MILFTPGCEISNINVINGQDYLTNKCSSTTEYIKSWKNSFVDSNGNSLYKTNDTSGLFYGTLWSGTSETISMTITNSYTNNNKKITVFHDNSDTIDVSDDFFQHYDNASAFACANYAGLVIIGPPFTNITF